MSKDVTYEEYSSRRVSEATEGGPRVERKCEKRVTHTTRTLSDNSTAGARQNGAIEDDARSDSSRISDAYRVSYPPSLVSEGRAPSVASSVASSNRSTIRGGGGGGSDHSSNSSERTTDQLTDFDLLSSASCGDLEDLEAASVRSNASSRRSSSEMRSSKTRDLYHHRHQQQQHMIPRDPLFDERLEDLATGFDDRLAIRRHHDNHHRRMADSLWRDHDSFFGADPFFADDDDDFFSSSFARIERRRDAMMSRMMPPPAVAPLVPPPPIVPAPAEVPQAAPKTSAEAIARHRSNARRVSRMKMAEGYEEAVFGTARFEENDNGSSVAPKSHLRQSFGGKDEMEKFEVSVDVSGFRPNELLVKTEGTRLVVTAEAKDDVERRFTKDRQFAARQFRQEFDLPDDVNPYEVVSSLGSDGTLKIEAPISRPTSEADSFR